MLWAEVRASVRFSCWKKIKIIDMIACHVLLQSVLFINNISTWVTVRT